MFWRLAYDQALWRALVAGWQKEGELATTSVEFKSMSNSPVALSRLSAQISANQCESETSVNMNKH